MSTGEYREHKFTETDMVNTLYYIYKQYNRVATFPYSSKHTNCNIPIVEHYDKDPNKFIYSCLPRGFINKQLLGFAPDSFSKKVAVDLLYKKINSYKLTDLIAWMTSNNHSKNHVNFAEACFKPYSKINTDPLPDFNNITTEHREASRVSYWVSNKSIRLHMLPFCKKYSADFMGTIYLNFLNKIPPNKRLAAFDNSMIKTKLVDRIKAGTKRVYIGYICLFDHWSSLVVDKERKVIYHYNSQGYHPNKTHPNHCLMYSYDRIITESEHANGVLDRKDQPLIMYFLTNTMRELQLDKIIINYEQSQMLDGECGMFSLIHSILMVTEIYNNNNYANVYTFFKFFGDKRMREFRTLITTRTDSYLSAQEDAPRDKYALNTIRILEAIITQLKSE